MHPAQRVANPRVPAPPHAFPAACKYDLSASEERLDLIADLVVDTAMIPPDTFARAMKGAPGQSGGEAERFEVRMLATATVAGVQLTLPVRVSRVFLRAKVRLSLSLNGEAPYMSMLAISFVTEPDLDLAIDIGPVREAIRCAGLSGAQRSADPGATPSRPLAERSRAAPRAPAAVSGHRLRDRSP